MLRLGELVKPTPDLLLALAENMRQGDQDEVWALCRHTPFEALSYSVLASRDPWAWVVDGAPVCCFGVAQNSAVSTTVAPWFLSSEELPKYAKYFARKSKKLVDYWATQYPVMQNFVDERHTDAIRWLRWLGFNTLPAVRLGPDKMPFLPFEMRRPSCANPLPLPSPA